MFVMFYFQGLFLNDFKLYSIHQKNNIFCRKKQKYHNEYHSSRDRMIVLKSSENGTAVPIKPWHSRV